MKKVAIVYDRVNKWGGAERVLLALHEIFPEALLYTSVYDPVGAPWAKVFPEVRTSFLQKFPLARSNHEFFAALMPLAFEIFDFSDFELVISVTSEAAKGIRVKPGTLHICYCLTPTRYLWSGADFYFKNPPSKFNFIPFFRFLSMPFVKYLRRWDIIASQKPDRIIAISTEVKNRIEKYYKRDSNIIFPPSNSVLRDNQVLGNSEDKKYYLVVNRLIPYKKVDLVIRVFNRLGYPLYIVGSGSEEIKLKKIARNNIKFFGQVDEKKMVELYFAAKALIMPQEEDFGIVSIEAQSFGTPVIAYGKGGALDTVIPGKTGFFFGEQTVESLEKVIRNFNNSNYKSIDPQVCRQNAFRFSKERFKKEFLDLVKDAKISL